jgi:hypothetical protein
LEVVQAVAVMSLHITAVVVAEALVAIEPQLELLVAALRLKAQLI